MRIRGLLKTQNQSIEMSLSSEFQRLADIVKRLRQPDGCPWDKVQTHDTIKRNLVEETGEFLDALEDRNLEGMREELGDLMLQVIFHAQIAQESGEFTLEEICREEADKLVRRHPHVFGENHAANAAEALNRWEQSKVGEAGEQSRRKSVMDGVPRSMPGLSRAQKALVKAARNGFDWPSEKDAVAKIDEELAETKEALNAEDKNAFTEEVGDLLFTVVNLCRIRGVETEEALHGAIAKFLRRFKFMETETARSGKAMTDNSVDEWTSLWQEAKKKGL